MSNDRILTFAILTFTPFIAGVLVGWLYIGPKLGLPSWMKRP